MHRDLLVICDDVSSDYVKGSDIKKIFKQNGLIIKDGAFGLNPKIHACRVILAIIMNKGQISICFVGEKQIKLEKCCYYLGIPTVRLIGLTTKVDDISNCRQKIEHHSKWSTLLLLFNGAMRSFYGYNEEKEKRLRWVPNETEDKENYRIRCMKLKDIIASTGDIVFLLHSKSPYFKSNVDKVVRTMNTLNGNDNNTRYTIFVECDSIKRKSKAPRLNYSVVHKLIDRATNVEVIFSPNKIECLDRNSMLIVDDYAYIKNIEEISKFKNKFFIDQTEDKVENLIHVEEGRELIIPILDLTKISIVSAKALKEVKECIQSGQDISDLGKFFKAARIINKYQKEYAREYNESKLSSKKNKAKRWKNLKKWVEKIKEIHWYYKIRGLTDYCYRQQRRFDESSNQVLYTESLDKYNNLDEIIEKNAKTKIANSEIVPIQTSRNHAYYHGNISIYCKENVAIHIHCYYPDILNGILKKIRNLEIKSKIYITFRESIEDNVDKIASKYNTLNIELKKYNNIGRDIGPLIDGLGRYLDEKYKYHVHIHTKKSPHLNPIKSVIWRNKLIKQIIGRGRINALYQIIDFMERNEKIGVAYALSKRIHGPGLNKYYMKQLSSTIKGREVSSYWNDFPVGTMYIARSRCLSELYNLNTDVINIPEEPIQVDGTVLHAIERHIPLYAKYNKQVYGLVTTIKSR